MSTILTRAGKGSPLTNAEMDTNFTNLNTDKLELLINSITTGATITPGAGDWQYNITALAEATIIAAPSGTPIHGKKLIIRIKDNGTGRAITWNAIYRIIGTTLPVTTVANKTIYVGCEYNLTDLKWDVLAVGQEA